MYSYKVNYVTFEEDYHRTVTQLLPKILVNVTYHLDNKPLIIIIIIINPL